MNAQLAPFGHFVPSGHGSIRIVSYPTHTGFAAAQTAWIVACFVVRSVTNSTRFLMPPSLPIQW